ncbi:MAG TPA: hypothetical protein VHB70_02205 [Parafilimonas sp.]|nr:hypothetical protein [Parafilimonas sp.]
MKKIILALLVIIAAQALNAQDNYNNDNADDKGFKKENVFLGGSISLGFGSGSFGIGANPEVGYSFAQWLDGGVVFNVNYNSQKIYDANASGFQYVGKASSFNYGGGVFFRAYPVNFLFVQLQPEENWIAYTQKDVGTDLKYKSTVNATSLIGGIGYSQRVISEGNYFFMIGLDLLNNANSPYQDGYGHAQPIIRGGFDIYLHPSRKPKPAGHVL